MDSTTVRAQSSFRNPVRQLTGITASAEKRLLIWIANRLPLWVKPDHLTSLALAGMVGAGLSYWMASATYLGFVAATAGLVVNWFGDSLDGTLARVRKIERPRFGFYVDHVVDVLGIACLLGGLALSGYMSATVAAVFLAAYLMLCVEIFLRTLCVGTFQMSFFGIGPTELRVLLAIGGFIAMGHPNATMFGHTYRLFDAGGVIGAAGLFVTFLTSAADGTRVLYRAEPAPANDRTNAPDLQRTLAMMNR